MAPLLHGFRESAGEIMVAYLAMMSARLVELGRVLKPTGSIYLH
jgi:site-specific DNA-methyltransferase (adenine-specific)